jgi:hypothetical protein
MMPEAIAGNSFGQLWVLQVAGSNPAAPTTRLRFAIAGQKMADRKLRRSIWHAWTDPIRAAAE